MLPSSSLEAIIAAIFSMALAGGLKPEDAAFITNIAAGVVISKSGTYAVTREDILQALMAG